MQLGSKHLYVFHHPQDVAKNPNKNKAEETPTYSSAQEEIAANSGFDMKKGPDRSKGLPKSLDDYGFYLNSLCTALISQKMWYPTTKELHCEYA